VAAVVENLPFRGLGLETRAIGGEAIEAQLADAPLDPLADLAAYLAESRPPQVEARQSPLQESRAIVAHDGYIPAGSARRPRRRPRIRDPAAVDIRRLPNTDALTDATVAGTVSLSRSIGTGPKPGRAVPRRCLRLSIPPAGARLAARV
jgi:hypothetical protein